MRVLLFGGTSEGRTLAQWLVEHEIQVRVSVATEYGARMLEEIPGLTLYTGPMNLREMEGLIKTEGFDCVVDATHPYAVQVTEHIQEAAHACMVAHYRLLRDNIGAGDWLHATDMEQAADIAAGFSGNILLSTGTRRLQAFAKPGLLDRCYVRILPDVDSLTQCLAFGFAPKRILCMHGPFSKNLNQALMEQYEIGVLVTKSSGAAGGFQEKLDAAEALGCKAIVVDRPRNETGMTMEEIQGALLHKKQEELR